MRVVRFLFLLRGEIMERKRTTSLTKALEEQPVKLVTAKKEPEQIEVVSIAQIQSLVRLLDQTDVAELELKQESEGIHLVLRKVKAGESSAQAGEIVISAASSNGVLPAASGEAHSTEAAGSQHHKVVAPLVGIFHPWLKPRGGTLVAVGDRVKVGQLVGTIESLNVFNEVETTVVGRVVEIHVVDGQPVEYGQVLVTIDSSDVEEA
jgi:acetyl-CoA carboxylase biotin carboxyl carrier protein